ncbi:MAG TPA: sigma factor-like helix-turn-helix DNA-binding protein [Solirubrobacteraceae bacterium]|nr:sigma factor-like helix-turn-helix DNA-binding protein [Solirubrobacteraceae bacterium]
MPTPQPTPATAPAPLAPLLEPAGCEDCCLAPGSLQRVRRMQALRECGWSLDEIALRFGVSRERVRQIMRAHRSAAPEDIAAARRRRAEAQAEARAKRGSGSDQTPLPRAARSCASPSRT